MHCGCHGTPAAVGNRLAERVVRGKDTASCLASSAGTIHAVFTPVKKCKYCRRKGHDEISMLEEIPASQTAKGPLGPPDSSAPSYSSYLSSQGPPASKRPRVNIMRATIMRAKVTTFYTHAPDPRWIVGSAATSHVCWNRECFNSFSGSTVRCWRRLEILSQPKG
jgi:hypothetical protein